MMNNFPALDVLSVIDYFKMKCIRMMRVMGKEIEVMIEGEFPLAATLTVPEGSNEKYPLVGTWKWSNGSRFEC
jgi:hypothetical protein